MIIPSLQTRIDQISNPKLREACQGLHTGQFNRWPASLKFHHTHTKGLLDHTLEVFGIADHLGKFMGADMDVLLTAALWHDVAKTKEYTYNDETGEGPFFKYSGNYQKRIHHINGGAAMFCHQAWLAGVPEPTIEAVMHCILAHHGPVKDWGSPVAPQTLEALILHQADMLSAHYGPTR